MPSHGFDSMNQYTSEMLFELRFKNEMERMTGIEPASRAWKALVLPLNYIRMLKPE